MLETGEFDYAWNLQVEPEILTQMEAAGKGEIVIAFGTSVERLHMNQTNPDPSLPPDKRSVYMDGKNPHPFLTDPAVLKAMSMAIDREPAHRGSATAPAARRPATSCRRPALYASTANDDCLTQDIEGAKKLLDEAGWSTRTATASARRTASSCRVLYQTSTNSVRQGTQALIKQWWDELGIETELRNVSASVFFGGDPASPDTFQKFYADVEMYTNNFAGVDPEAYMADWRCDAMPGPSTQWQGTNIQRYCDPEYDALTKQMANTADIEKRGEIAKKMNDMLVQTYTHPAARPPRRRLGACEHARRRQDVRLGQRALEHPGLDPRQDAVTLTKRGAAVLRAAPHPQTPSGGPRMLRYTIRRLIFAIPTLLVISFIIFALLDLAPSDPTANLPLTIPPEVREQIRQSLGLGEPFHIRYLYWLQQFFVNEPLNIIEEWTGWTIGNSDRLRVVSWSTRSPVVDLIVERMPQTLWVVGMSYVVGIADRHPDRRDLGLQAVFLVRPGRHVLLDGRLLGADLLHRPAAASSSSRCWIPTDSPFWLPSIYDTTLRVTDWDSFVYQVKQMIMPVMVLALSNAAQISRFMRASMLDNLNQDYVRTARAKGLSERVVVLLHVLRNSLIPVVTIIALGMPQIFGGAIITEQIFKVNGLGALLIGGIEAADIPLVQTLTFIFAVLIVLFNLIADVLYGILDPRIRYD